MHEYYVRKCENGKDGNLTERHFNESKESVKSVSVNAKLEAEVIRICVVPIWLGHNNLRKMFKRCSKHMLCWLIAAKVHSLGMIYWRSWDNWKEIAA